ncbi:hypothetical protein An02g06210 [Aspergillus niger]|uniref:Uncharacterized protein n=2 Tax=Aspergillus niger TaxID=5061 RepID=A2QD88_ASPNC|nr:hypothetical protein An02g06210 [Aspergillus niger]CAK37670.1 hypothetical protein An02g06210 [Aspergillus niger]
MVSPSNEQVSHEPLNLDGGEVIRVGFELELAQGSCAYIGHGNRTGCRGGVQCGGTCSQRKDGREHYLASRGASRGAAEEGTRRTLAQGLYICSRKQVDKIADFLKAERKPFQEEDSAEALEWGVEGGTAVGKVNSGRIQQVNYEYDAETRWKYTRECVREGGGGNEENSEVVETVASRRRRSSSSLAAEDGQACKITTK